MLMSIRNQRYHNSSQVVWRLQSFSFNDDECAPKDIWSKFNFEHIVRCAAMLRISSNKHTEKRFEAHRRLGWKF